ncbi:hypothetical protein MRX96_025488 [Rhipicephalus microplus]
MFALDLPRCRAPSRRQLEVEEAVSALTSPRNPGGFQGSSDLAGVVDGRPDRVGDDDGVHSLHSDEDSDRNGGDRLESGPCDSCRSKHEWQLSVG